MSTVRLKVARRHTPPVTERAENVDLDEKIRRIREANKERERRFLEVEQDKKLALMSSNEGSDEDNTGTQNKVKKEQPKHAIMKGIQAVTKKRTTGRGQRLLEMSHHPLKAASFELRMKEMRFPEQSLSDTVTLKNRCRSTLRDKIKSRNKECEVPVDANENVEIKNHIISNHNKKLDRIAKKEFNESTAETLCENENLSHETEETNTDEFDTRTQDPAEIETTADTESSVAPFETNVPDPEETQEILDSVEKQETVKATGKNDKPTVKVDLKKTASSSSFDESIAMLSPLDLPQNWGDLEFSDDDIPSVSTWRN